MANVSRHKGILRLTLAGTLMGFLSLVLPWWSFVLLVRNNFVAGFNLFLWGIIKSGFVRASLSFEWWSYLTLSIVLASSLFGFGGYMLVKRESRNSKRMVALQGIFAIAGCLLYLCGLFITFNRPIPDMWMVPLTEGSSPIMIAILSVFNIRHIPSLELVVLEFLSAGFWVAVMAAVFSTIASYKLHILK